jgi:hypothetical protein
MDYEAMKTGMVATTEVLRSGMAAIRDKAARIPQTDEHRRGVLRGIDLCLELVDRLEGSADDMIAEVRVALESCPTETRQ